MHWRRREYFKKSFIHVCHFAMHFVYRNNGIYNFVFPVTFAAAAIFGYWWVIPAMLWGMLWWRGSQAGYTFMEMICVYGYSLAIYIPISVSISWPLFRIFVLELKCSIQDSQANSGNTLVVRKWLMSVSKSIFKYLLRYRIIGVDWQKIIY